MPRLLMAALWVAGSLADGTFIDKHLTFAEEQVQPEQAQPEPLLQFQRAAVVHFPKPISRASQHYLLRKLELAKNRDVDLVILQIDSPGGELRATEYVANQLLDIDWAHTVAYIPREAISGAAIISLACDDIVMRPTAVLGDAGVIVLDEKGMFRFAEAKVVSELAVRVRTIAEATGRPPALAEAMVDRNAVVYKVRHARTGAERLMNEADIAGSDEPDQWEKVHMIVESQRDRFLHLNGARAVELGLAEAVVEDQQQLYARYGIDEPVVVYRWTAADTAAAVLNHPIATFLLLFIGVVALYVEFLSPGLGAGGVVAGVCFVVFFWSRFLGGTADWLEVVLFGAGVALMLVEMFVMPGFGVWGVTGFLLMLAGLVLSGQDFLIPETTADWAVMRRSVLVVVLSMVAVMVAAMVITSRMGQIPGLSRLTLSPPPAPDPAADGGISGAGTIRAEDGATVRVGDQGIAESPLRPAGVVRFGNDYVDVVTQGIYVDRGSHVVVTQIAGNRVVVRQVET